MCDPHKGLIQPPMRRHSQAYTSKKPTEDYQRRTAMLHHGPHASVEFRAESSSLLMFHNGCKINHGAIISHFRLYSTFLYEPCIPMLSPVNRTIIFRPHLSLGLPFPARSSLLRGCAGISNRIGWLTYERKQTIDFTVAGH
jgi:hypothetical protein